MKTSLYEDYLKQVELKNGLKLIVRKPKVEDANNMIDYLNIVGGESDNLLFGHGEFRFTIDQEKEYIENMNKEINSLMLLGIIDNKIVSVSQISTNNRKRIAHNSEIALSVKKEYWGLGIGSAIMELLIEFAKENNNIKNISLGVKAENLNAIKLYEKKGFKKVGFHKDFFYINENYYDEILMDLNLLK